MKTETIDFKVAHLRNFDPIGKEESSVMLHLKEAYLKKSWNLCRFFFLYF